MKTLHALNDSTTTTTTVMTDHEWKKKRGYTPLVVWSPPSFLDVWSILLDRFMIVTITLLVVVQPLVVPIQQLP